MKNDENENCTAPRPPKWFGLAVEALVILSSDRIKNGCASSELAANLNSDPSLLRKILAVLVKEGYLETREGREGGYRLCKPPETIWLVDIYDLFRAGSSLQFCVNMGKKSAWDDITSEMNTSMRVVLEKYTIADIVERQEEIL